MDHVIAGVPTAGTGSRSSAAVAERAASKLTGGSGTPNRWQRKHVVLLAGIGALLGVLRAEASIDTDSLWAARYGIDVLTTGHLPRSDSYSWTAHGTRWIPSSWLWNMLLGASYELAGVVGIWVLSIIVAISIALAVAIAGRRFDSPPLPTVVGFAMLGMLTLVVSPRAEAVSIIFVVVLPALLPGLFAVSNMQFVLRLLSVVAVQTLWMNVHSAALIGPFVLAAAGAGLITEPLLRGRRRAASARLGAAVLLSTACCLLTPYGVEPLTHAAEVRSASIGLITEWDHVGFGTPAQVVALIMVAAGFGLAWQAARATRFSSAALLIMFAVATAYAIRFTTFELLTAMPEIGFLLAGLRVRPLFLRRGLIAVVTIFGAFTVAHLTSLGRLDDVSGSPKLVAELPAHCVLVNDYEVGGAVVLLRADVQVSVDGRNDMYGRKRVLSAIHMLQDEPGTQRRLDTAGVNCILAMTPYGLVQRLRSDPAWSVVGSDSVRTLLVRKGQP